MIEYPHDAVEMPLEIKEMKNNHGQTRKDKESQFDNYYPWLEFKNSGKLYYQGKHTEKYSPFFTRFDVSQIQTEQQIMEQRHFELQKMNEMMRIIEKQRKQYAKLKEGDKWQEFLLLNKKSSTASKKQDLYLDESVNHAYILNGLAKPTVTVNDVFDVLFPRQSQDESHLITLQNKKSEFKLLFNSSNEVSMRSVIKDSWDFKKTSYEYYKFMCLGLKCLKQQYYRLQCESKQKYDQQWSKQKLKEELFNLYSVRTQHFITKNKQTINITDRQYYDYFYKVIYAHYATILQKMEEFQQQKSNEQTLTIKISPQYQLILHKFNYATFVDNLYKGQQIGIRQRSNTILHYSQHHNNIIVNYQFKTKQQRKDRLMSLQNSNRSVYDKIQLIPLIDLQEISNGSSLYNQTNNYMIVHYRQNYVQAMEDINFLHAFDKWKKNDQKQRIKIQQTIFKQYIDKIIAKLHQLMQKPNTNIFPFLNYFSFQPKHIIFNEYKSLSPNFETALTNYLQFNSLPLSLQQNLLGETPNPSLTSYEVAITLSSYCLVYLNFNRELSEDMHEIIVEMRRQMIQNKIRQLKQEQIGRTMKQREVEMDKAIGLQIQNKISQLREEELLFKMKSLCEMLTNQEYRFTYISKETETLQKLIQTDDQEHANIQNMTNQQKISILMLSFVSYELQNSQNFIFNIEKGTDYSKLDENDSQQSLRLMLVVFIKLGVVRNIKIQYENQETTKDWNLRIEALKKIRDGIVKRYDNYEEQKQKGEVICLFQMADKIRKTVGKKIGTDKTFKCIESAIYKNVFYHCFMKLLSSVSLMKTRLQQMQYESKKQQQHKIQQEWSIFRNIMRIIKAQLQALPDFKYYKIIEQELNSIVCDLFVILGLSESYQQVQKRSNQEQQQSQITVPFNALEKDSQSLIRYFNAMQTKYQTVQRLFKSIKIEQLYLLSQVYSSLNQLNKQNKNILLNQQYQILKSRVLTFFLYDNDLISYEDLQLLTTARPNLPESVQLSTKQLGIKLSKLIKIFNLLAGQFFTLSTN